MKCLFGLFKIDHDDDFDNDYPVNVIVFVNDVVDDRHAMNYVDDDVYEIDTVRNCHLDDDDDADDQESVIVNDCLYKQTKFLKLFSFQNSFTDVFYLDGNRMMTMLHCQMFRAYQ